MSCAINCLLPASRMILSLCPNPHRMHPIHIIPALNPMQILPLVSQPGIRGMVLLWDRISLTRRIHVKKSTIPYKPILQGRDVVNLPHPRIHTALALRTHGCPMQLLLRDLICLSRRIRPMYTHNNILVPLRTHGCPMQIHIVFSEQ